MAEKKSMYLKHCEVVSQPEFINGKVGDILREHKVIKKYAYILHDKDPEIKPHYHLFLDVFNIYDCLNVYLEEIAEWFDIPSVYIDRGYPIRIELNYMLQSRKLMLYQPSDIVANFDIMPYLNGSEE